jgi:hypothetical protein
MDDLFGLVRSLLEQDGHFFECPKRHIGPIRYSISEAGKPVSLTRRQSYPGGLITYRLVVQINPRYNFLKVSEMIFLTPAPFGITDFTFM